MVYCMPYEVRMLAQVEYAQVGFSSNGDLEDFITHYLIPQADKKIDSYCNHSFGTLTVGTWSLDGSGKAILFMPTERCPLLGITAGTIDNTAVTTANLKVHDQYLDYDGGVFTSGKKNVTLSGSYGYTSVPADIESASAMLCANALTDMVRKRVLPEMFQRENSGAILSSSRIFTKELKAQLDPYVIKQVDIG